MENNKFLLRSNKITEFYGASNDQVKGNSGCQDWRGGCFSPIARSCRDNPVLLEK